jgi:hypothetical protein
MNLIDDWRRVVRTAWSIRLIALAGLFSGLDAILPLFVADLPRGIFAALSLVAAMGGAWARVVQQPKMERRAKPRAKPDHERADYD